MTTTLTFDQIATIEPMSVIKQRSKNNATLKIKNALMSAIYNRKTADVIKLIDEEKVDPNFVIEKAGIFYSPLSYAYEKTGPEMIQILLERKASDDEFYQNHLIQLGQTAFKAYIKDHSHEEINNLITKTIHTTPINTHALQLKLFFQHHQIQEPLTKNAIDQLAHTDLSELPTLNSHVLTQILKRPTQHELADLIFENNPQVLEDIGYFSFANIDAANWVQLNNPTFFNTYIGSNLQTLFNNLPTKSNKLFTFLNDFLKTPNKNLLQTPAIRTILWKQAIEQDRVPMLKLLLEHQLAAPESIPLNFYSFKLNNTHTYTTHVESYLPKGLYKIENGWRSGTYRATAIHNSAKSEYAEHAFDLLNAALIRNAVSLVSVLIQVPEIKNNMTDEHYHHLAWGHPDSIRLFSQLYPEDIPKIKGLHNDFNPFYAQLIKGTTNQTTLETILRINPEWFNSPPTGMTFESLANKVFSSDRIAKMNSSFTMLCFTNRKTGLVKMGKSKKEHSSAASFSL